jgi:hypothetical protein
MSACLDCCLPLLSMHQMHVNHNVDVNTFQAISMGTETGNSAKKKLFGD